jgi:xanthine/uracil permease
MADVLNRVLPLLVVGVVVMIVGSELFGTAEAGNLLRAWIPVFLFLGAVVLGLRVFRESA